MRVCVVAVVVVILVLAALGKYTRRMRNLFTSVFVWPMSVFLPS